MVSYSTYGMPCLEVSSALSRYHSRDSLDHQVHSFGLESQRIGADLSRDHLQPLVRIVRMNHDKTSGVDDVYDSLVTHPSDQLILEIGP